MKYKIFVSGVTVTYKGFKIRFDSIRYSFICPTIWIETQISTSVSLKWLLLMVIL